MTSLLAYTSQDEFPHSAALERLQVTLATLRGSSNPEVAFTPNIRSTQTLGAFVLQKRDTRLQVDVVPEANDASELRLILNRMDTFGVQNQKQGDGSAQLKTLFDIADDSGINRIDVTCAESGRYAHAANHARVLPEDWPALQEKLRKVLSNYCRAEQFPSRTEQSHRLAQAEPVAATLSECDGRLGMVVNAARTPLTNSINTLGQMLFLDPQIRSYYASWLPEDREACRAKLSARNICSIAPGRHTETVHKASPIRLAQHRRLANLRLLARS